jgi:hypothetical protein
LDNSAPGWLFEQSTGKQMNHETLWSQRRALARSPELWQFDLLSADEFGRFTQDRGMPVLAAGTVSQLWRVGLLRADLVTASSRLTMPGLEDVSDEDGVFAYCDTRQTEQKSGGYGGSFASIGSELDSIELLFHPFRLFVMYHIHRVFRSNASSIQYLLNSEGLINLAKLHIDSLDRWTSDEQCAERFEHWNRCAELAIVLEPTAYSEVFQSLRWRFPDTEEVLRAKLLEHDERVRNLVTEMQSVEINAFRTELCQQAEFLDDNKLVHVLLRLMSAHERLKLHSALGGCMLFLCMAEIIRRAAQNVLGLQLPEEDELGFGQWMPGARKSLYGSERILDAPRHDRRDFLTSMGLEYGIKVRCYVEGETEFGALTSAVGDAGGIEFINLRGQVVERKGRGLNFAASLEIDIKSRVFSVVLLDEDRDDNVRAVKQAAASGRFFGRFFISSPDIEFANFSLSELTEIALQTVPRDGRVVPAVNELASLVAEAKSGEHLLELLEQQGLSGVRKSETWGVALMNFALRHQVLPPDHKKAGERRWILNVAELLIQARNAGYLRSLRSLVVNADTGELLPKDGPESPIDA